MVERTTEVALYLVHGCNLNFNLVFRTCPIKITGEVDRQVLQDIFKT